MASLRTSLIGLGVSAVAITASMPPWGLWPAAPAGLALLIHFLGGCNYRQRFVRVFGVLAASNLVTLWWLWDLHVAGYLLLPPILAAMVAVVTAAVSGDTQRYWSVPFALTLAEALRWSWPWGGVPLSNLALGQVGGPLLEVARVSTALGVVTAVAMLGGGLAAAYERRIRAAATLTTVVVVAILVAVVSPRGEAVGNLDMAILQGGGELGTRAINTDERELFEGYLETAELVETPVEIVLWPEDVVDIDGPLVDSPEGAELETLATDLDAVMVVGVVESFPDSLNNAAVVIDPVTGIGDRYDKVNLVPFGEFVPFRSLVDRFVDLSVVPKDANRGTGPASVDTRFGRFGVVISFELFFPRRAADGITDGGRLLLGPTNASSYTNGMVPEQTLASSRLRAVETGRWVAQAAPTGYSAFVDEEGKVRSRTGLRERRVLHDTVELREGRTLALGLGGDLVVWAALVAVALSMVRSRLISPARA